MKSWGSVVGDEGTEIGHSWGQDHLLQTSGEETGLSLQQQQFLAVATLGFINIIPLLLDLVYHNCILFDFTDVNNNNNNNTFKLTYLPKPLQTPFRLINSP